MNTEIDNIIKQKNYHDLSGDELRLIEREGITKEDFIQLKLFFQQLEVDKLEKSAVTKDIKTKLDAEFQKKYKKSRVIPLWKDSKHFLAQPVLHVAAAITLLILVFNFLNLEDNTKNLADNTVLEKKQDIPQENDKETKPEKTKVEEDKEPIEKEKPSTLNEEAPALIKAEIDEEDTQEVPTKSSEEQSEIISSSRFKTKSENFDKKRVEVADEMDVRNEKLSEPEMVTNNLTQPLNNQVQSTIAIPEEEFASVQFQNDNDYASPAQSTSLSESNLTFSNNGMTYNVSEVHLVFKPSKSIDDELELLTPLF